MPGNAGSRIQGFAFEGQLRTRHVRTGNTTKKESGHIVQSWLQNADSCEYFCRFTCVPGEIIQRLSAKMEYKLPKEEEMKIGDRVEKDSSS